MNYNDGTYTPRPPMRPLDLKDKFKAFSDLFQIKDYRRKMVYCLTNYENVSTEEHIERALYRIYSLRDMGYDPYCMVYDKPHAPLELRRLQRWCNSKFIFKAEPDFSKYR